MKHGGSRKARDKNQEANLPLEHSETTLTIAAEQFSVSERSIKTARKIQKNGIPELVKAVDEGTACHVRGEGCEHETGNENRLGTSRKFARGWFSR
jgi:hypothetical protein